MSRLEAKSKMLFYNQRHDNTRTERVARRRNRLNEMARELGFNGLSQMLTKWKNGEIILTIKENTQ